MDAPGSASGDDTARLEIPGVSSCRHTSQPATARSVGMPTGGSRSWRTRSDAEEPALRARYWAPQSGTSRPMPPSPASHLRSPWRTELNACVSATAPYLLVCTRTASDMCSGSRIRPRSESMSRSPCPTIQGRLATSRYSGERMPVSRRVEPCREASMRPRGGIDVICTDPRPGQELLAYSRSDGYNQVSTLRQELLCASHRKTLPGSWESR